MHRVPEEAVLRTEYLFRTVEACFEHRSLLKMRRVPQEAFLSTARIFRTVKACFWYRVLTQRQVAAAVEPGVQKKEADYNHNMFLAPFDLLVAVDPMVGADMTRGPWAAYAAGSLSLTYA